jgi:hypothetical protein
MLTTWLIVLMCGALLAAAGFLGFRKRGAHKATTFNDDEDSRVAPFLIMPQTRNNGWGRVPPIAVRQPSPPEAARSYIAPLSGTGVDGTLQLWPGRLEPADGGGDHEIRFIRTPGANRFTFGRSAGPAYTHIQLLAPTASRMHAYMIVENGRWRIGNMSSTNAVRVNGDALATGDADRWLEDGDRIELGEVSFIFRER